MLSLLHREGGASTLMETKLQDVRLCGLPENQGSLSTNGSHEPFHRIDMHFTKAVAIFISGVLAPSMVDTLMIISPCPQAGINAVPIRINKRTWSNGFF